MVEPVSVAVRPLTPALLADYLAFFDAKAFPDNPRWAFCYCYFPYHDPERTEWQKRTGDGGSPRRCWPPPEGLRAQGMRIAEAKPMKDAKTPAANHYGPLALYLSAGFSVVREDDDGNVFVRKALAPMERIE